MQTQFQTPVRRRSGYNVVPAGPEESPASATPGSALLRSICSTLGGWVQDQPEQSMIGSQDTDDNQVAERAQSIVQVLEGMGTWALQAAALNICLPSSNWLKPGQISRNSSRCSSMSPPRRHPMHPPSNASSRTSSERDLAVRAAARDTRKSAGQLERCKTPTAHETAHRCPTADAAVSDAAAAGTSRVAELMAANECLQREVTCLRTSVGALFVTCSNLKEENQRLRVAVDESNEELLSDALEQLLGEKNALQQEVAKLKQQNKALQELLEYTAPAAAPSASEGQAWTSAAYDGGSSSNLAGMAAATPAASMYSNTSWAGDAQHVPSAAAAAQDQGSMWQAQQQQQQQEWFGYWLATPAVSVAESSVGEPAGRLSPTMGLESELEGEQQHIETSPGEQSAAAADLAGLSDPVVQQQQEQQCAAADVDAEHPASIDTAIEFSDPCSDSQQQQQPGLERQQVVLKSVQPGRHVGKQQLLRLDTSSSNVVGVMCVEPGPLSAHSSPGRTVLPTMTDLIALEGDGSCETDLCVSR